MYHESRLFNRKRLLITGLSASFCFSATEAEGQNLFAEYKFDGDSLVSTDTDLTSTATDLNIPDWIHPGNPGANVADPFANTGSIVARTSYTNPIGTDLLSDAIPAQNYIGFTVTGFDFNLDQFSFDFITSSSSTYQYSAYVLSSLTGFTAADALSTTAHNGSHSSNVSFSLAGNSALQNVSGPVEFRIYLSDNTGVNHAIHRIDNISLQGSYALIEQICNSETDVYMSGGDFFIGDTANGCWTLTNGTKTNHNAQIGIGVGVNGSATVDGSNAVWENTGDLTVGVNGTGGLAIKNGGTVQATNFIFNDDPDWQAGTLIVDGGSLSGTGELNGFDINSSSGFVVGSSGGQTLVLQNGATHASASLYLGWLSGENGTLVIDGSGSSLDTSSGNASIGGYGQGTLTISNGGSLTSGHGFIGMFENGTGTATVNGSGSSWNISARLWVGDTGTGTVNVTGGGDVSASKIYLGGYGGDTGDGTMNIDGVGSTATADWITLAHTGDASIHITNGGELLVTGGSTNNIGSGYSASALITIDGAGSEWNYDPASTANIHIQQADTTGNANRGALVQITNGAVFNSKVVRIGNSTGTRGTVEVDGIGSQWNTTDGVYVAQHGEGTVAFTNTASGNWGTTMIGSNSGSNGTVTLENGSTLEVDSLTVGKYGTGTLMITNNGSQVISYGNAMFGMWNGGDATVVIDGYSTSLNAAKFDIGNSTATASLEVSNGGKLKAYDNSAIGRYGILSGDGLVEVYGTQAKTLTNAGIVAPGNAGDELGILTLNANYTQASTGELAIDLGGTAIGSEYDSLDVDYGSVHLNGDLTINFINGHTLSSGDSYTIIDSESAVSGTFTGLSEGALVGTYNLNDLYITYAGGGDGYDVVLYSPMIMSSSLLVAVPEPSSLAMLAIGGLGLVRRRRLTA